MLFEKEIHIYYLNTFNAFQSSNPKYLCLKVLYEHVVHPKYKK